MTKKPTIKFDAEGKVMGRLATQVALAMQGKNMPDFQPHLLTEQEVVVYNLSKVKLNSKKLQQKKYYRYSGYPSGMKEKTAEQMFNLNPSLLFKSLIKNMLPKNKLQAKMLKSLKLFNEEIK
ncbi:50S ribosomal protein L13 [Patescibacteria group bacterium]|nr:50S ribosomal protein L13 [Patescibacteria group bacterium]